MHTEDARGNTDFYRMLWKLPAKKINGLGRKKSKGLGVREGWQKECGSLHTKQQPTTEQDPTDLCTQGI